MGFGRKKKGNESVTICNQLKIQSVDGNSLSSRPG